MEVVELIRKVRKIEIKAKEKVQDIFSGAYHSAFKGRGMSFSESRKYQYGDDVRNIDWNVTARTREAHVKVFEEERQLSIMFLIDMSASTHFGSNQDKSEYITEVAAVLAFNAMKNNDNVGAILFDNDIVKFIPLASGKNHVLTIIREVLNYEKKSSGTNLSKALQYLAHVVKKKCVCFVLSDFLVDDYVDDLKIVSKKHEIIPVKFFDELEIDFPELGILQLRNAENGETIMIDTDDIASKKIMKGQYLNHQNYLDNALKKAGLKSINVDENTDYIKSFIKYFVSR